MNDADFTDWLRTAPGGAKFVYAVAPCLALAGGTAQHVATSALRAFYKGEVELVQKRISGPPDGRFEYIAIKRWKVVPLHRPLWIKLPKVRVAA